jgi:hypothetical protein
MIKYLSEEEIIKINELSLAENGLKTIIKYKM